MIEIQLNQAKKDLEAAQKSKEEAEKTLKAQLVEKEQLLNTAQKEKNDAYDKLQAALDAKQKAEKVLAEVTTQNFEKKGNELKATGEYVYEDLGTFQT